MRMEDEENDYLTIKFDLAKDKYFSDLGDADLLKYRESVDMKERIDIYKITHHMAVDYYKRMMYALEYAYQVYQKESKTGIRTISVDVLSIPDRLGVPYEYYMYCAIVGLWSLLDFRPEAGVKFHQSENSTELNFTRSYFQPKYVKYLPDINHLHTDHFLGFDNDKFEKGRQFQWMT